MGVYAGVELNEVVLTGQRLLLRPWRADDARAVHAIMQDPTMHRFLPIPDPYTLADAVEYVTRRGEEGRTAGTGLGCAVVERGSGELVGSAALRLPQRAGLTAEIGYWTAPAARGGGVAAEASRMLASWAFDHGVARVEIRCAVTNLASARVALAAGFRFEAVLRGDVWTAEGATEAPPGAAPGGVSAASAGAPTVGGPVDGAVFGRLPGDSGERIQPALPPLPSEGLTDGVLALRVVRPEDAVPMIDELNSAASVGWSFDGKPIPEPTIAAMAARAGLDWLVGPTGRLAMIDVASGEVAGSLALRLSGPPGVGDIGYGVRPSFRGRGFTARALRLLSQWAFETACLARLELGAKRGNVASQKAALAGGFEPDGVRLGRLANPDGSYGDEVRFALVNPAVPRRN